MKVLWFSNTPAMGEEYLNKTSKIKGTGGWMYSLNKALQHKVELAIAFHYPYNKQYFEYQQTSFYPIYTGNIIIENIKKRIIGGVYDEDFLVQYLRVIDLVKPDIIHIHGTENSFLCILGKTEIPVVLSIQGNLTVYIHKFLSGFHGKYLSKKSGNISLKTFFFGRNSFQKGFSKMKKMASIEQKYLFRAQYIIGRTDWDKRITRVLAPGSKYYLGNEILRSGFYENHWANNQPEGKFIIFTTNGNNYYKGFETICHTLQLLKNVGMDIEWRVAGVSENSLINLITKKILGNNYPEKGLVLLGSLDENELISNLRESHLYVMPSHIENSPNNLCEAMIMGMPCIATFAGGTGSMLTDGEEGILVQDGDPWSMAGSVLELKNDQEKALKFGKAARERAFLRHSKEKIVINLMETYKTIIDDKN